MSPISIGVIGLVVLFGFLALGIPIGFAMALVGFAGYAVIAGLPAALTQIGTVPFTTVSSYTLTVLPLFILMGEFAFTSGLVRGAYFAMHKWVGHLPGGLAIATVGASAAFAAVCGSSVASASLMTSVAYSEMKSYQYNPKLALGSIACGGTLGILIPPSNAMILYCIFSDQSVGQLFMAGFLPGILLTLLFIIVVYVTVKIDPTQGPRAREVTWHEKLSAIKDIWPVAILAIFVLGGIWGGVFSPAEAAGAGAFGALVIGLVRRQITKKNVMTSLTNTVKTTAMIFTILIGAMIFNYFIVVAQIPTVLATFVENLALPPMGVLLAVLVVYLILGSLMDTMAMTVLTLPIFVPMLLNLGFDLVWFGIVFVIMCEMALVTPPIGMNVFVVSGMAGDVPMYTIFRGITPFLLAMVLCLALVIAFPQIALFLPHSMIK
jgi:C4-dicarboxylate transporter DctM subunit